MMESVNLTFLAIPTSLSQRESRKGTLEEVNQ